MRALVVVALLGSSGCLFGSCGPSPQSHTCRPGGAQTSDALELGPPSPGGRPDDPFAPFVAGDPVCVQLGGQGLTMIQARLRVSGPSAPACVTERIEVRDANGALIASSDASIEAALGSDGARTTANVLLPGDYPAVGARVTLSAHAAGRDASVVLTMAADCPYLTPGLDLAAPAVDAATAD